PHRGTQFPFGSEVEELKPSFFVKVKGASTAAIDLVKELKPYEGGNRLLWQLHELDIRDKHRLLVPVGAAHKGITVRFELSDPASGKMFSFPELPILAADRQFPLKDGAELYREPLISALKNETKIDLEIAFGEGQIFDGQEVIGALDKLGSLTASIIGLFE